MKPTDCIDEIYINDFVDSTWEILRLRRLKAEFMRAKARSAISDELNVVLKQGADALAAGWGQQKPGAVRKVNRIMANEGTTSEMVIAEAMADHLNELAAIDHMLDAAEARRNSALHELDRHRTALAGRLRKAVEQIEEAEFKVLDGWAFGRERGCVTTERKIRANRTNAHSSTGPKSGQGRARSAKNALRHRLSLPIDRDPVLSKEVEELGREIAGPGANPEIQSLARGVAEAQLDLRRVRAAR